MGAEQRLSGPLAPLPNWDTFSYQLATTLIRRLTHLAPIYTGVSDGIAKGRAPSIERPIWR